MSPLDVSLAGAGVGLGAFIVLRALFGRRSVPLEDVARQLAFDGIRTPGARGAGEQPRPGLASPGLFGRGRARLTGLVQAGSSDQLEQRLRLVGKTHSQFVGEKLLLSVIGFCLPILVASLLATAGMGVPPGALLIGALMLAAAGFFYPALPLSEHAEVRRRDFRFGLGAYLDFVTTLVAGGAGTQSALQAAAEAGDGWTFESLRQAIRRADATGRTTWELFSELADDLGIEELRELAASVALAGGHGARVKDSLIAKADALRTSLAAELESLAEVQTEKMIIPVVVMIGGLVLFVGFGAATAIVSGGSLPPR